ncbi:ribbon-helix-helix domain-containing protein [Shimia sagamensis]|uniref:Predicted DNA-binding protein, contains Ribbon-helix-helix (RHH) domain n=1 Tax=Shimia sagamensis TaxID=1566352 RepID=A0ABY1NIN7_9RHOB|nr:ribbon-helix-helix domain-containing protein [Shimia sagamensis]SMP10084.1 Predicted DNA-binding protein, contains Ribbon-helix-helix (RHH) domain [Shimia sagamensis]
MSRPIKRSLTLRGHRTSVSLEDDFWRAFRDIANEKSLPINALAAEIDAERDLEAGLATAIRLYVLAHYRDQACGVADDRSGQRL